MKKQFRFLSILLCLSLLFSAVPDLHAFAAGGRTYRALLIGNAAYDGGQTLRAPLYDVAHMEQLLLQQDFNGVRFAPENIVKLTNATKLAMLETIRTELAERAGSDDVTYIYYSGHGTFDGTASYLVGVEMAGLSIDELKAALDAVQGQKVVILDCCYAGGFAGKSVDPGRTPGKPAMKSAGDGQIAGQSVLDGCRQFQEALMKPFQDKRSVTRRALTTSGYKVLAAASPFQYSYEYRFNVTGAACYGPLFRMNGTDSAGGSGNYSGEFTGMLVAGAGRVAFNDDFPEIRALADVDRDRIVTLDELYRYLRGAVQYSAVQVYPEGDQFALFQHSAVDAPDWGQPALTVEDNGAPYAPAAENPVRFGLTGGPAWPDTITISRARFVGDNRYADNADAVIEDVAQVSADGPVPDGAETTLFWDGTKQDGSPAGDGWYFAVLSSDRYVYPPIPFELRRGASNFPDAAVLPANQAFSVVLTSGKTTWYTFTPSSDGLLLVESSAGSTSPAAEAELCDADGNTLAWSSFDAQAGQNFRILRMLKAGQQVTVGVRASQGGGALPALCRYVTPSANNAPVSVDTSGVSYTLFRPDTSGMWTVRAKAAFDDGNSGITLYDSWLTPAAWGERYAESYRYLCAYLEAGRLYALETPKIPVPMTVAAYAPGRQPVLNTPSMPALSSSGTAVHIARETDTRFFRFTPSATAIYRFYSSAPVEGSAKVDSYAFLTDSRGTVLACDDDVNYETGLVQFDFSARLIGGATYVLAARAYVSQGQISSANPNLDFAVYSQSCGSSAEDQAVSAVAAAGKSVIALYKSGRLAGWGVSEDVENDGVTGLDFGEGLYCLRRWGPQLLYAPGVNAFTKVWPIGHAYAARDASGGIYAWGIKTEVADFGVIRRLDNPVNGLAKYDVTCMAQGMRQDELYFLDGPTGKIYSMQGLAGMPQEEPAPGLSFTHIASSEGSLFALDSAGGLYAKGLNLYGECGNGSAGAVTALTRIPLSASIVDFAAGDNHALALDSLGDVYAWGSNDYGSLGLGSLDRVSFSPAKVPLGGLLEPGEAVVRIFAGGNCSAALTNAGRLFAWGANDSGQLGIGGTTSRAAPVVVLALLPDALGSGRAVSQVVFGPESAYAILSDGSLCVSGRNDCGQLGFVSGPVKTFTPLSAPDLRSPNNRLQSLVLSAGRLSPSFSPETFEYNVVMPEGTALSTVSAIKADSAATLAIDGQKVSSKAVNAGPGPVCVEIAVTAQNGDVQSYVLNYPQSPSANADLSSLSLTAGCLSAPLNGTDSQYDVVIPETATGPVTLTPVLADPNSVFIIDGDPGLAGKTVTLSGGETAAMRVDVTAQLGNTRSYTFNIARNPILSAFSASPVYSGYGSLSPGGTNRLTFNYGLNCPAAVKIEIKKGSSWVTLLSRAETSAGGKSWVWDGKVNGSALASGTYAVRITPNLAGKAGTQRSLSVKILRQPYIYLTSLYPYTFTVNGSRTQRISFRWTQLTDVKAEIVTQSGSLVRSLYSAQNRAPGSQTVYWNGKSNSGSLLKAGYYKIKITCGGRVYYKTIRIKR